MVDLDPDREDRQPTTRRESVEQLDIGMQRRATVDTERLSGPRDDEQDPNLGLLENIGVAVDQTVPRTVGNQQRLGILDDDEPRCVALGGRVVVALPVRRAQDDER